MAASQPCYASTGNDNLRYNTRRLSGCWAAEQALSCCGDTSRAVCEPLGSKEHRVTSNPSNQLSEEQIPMGSRDSPPMRLHVVSNDKKPQLPPRCRDDSGTEQLLQSTRLVIRSSSGLPLHTSLGKLGCIVPLDERWQSSRNQAPQAGVPNERVLLISQDRTVKTDSIDG
jgi:hypothetical protein